MNNVNTLHWSILREYDIRGVVGDTLEIGDARLIGQAFGSLVKQNLGRTVCVAYDGRISSPDIARVVVDGLVSTGATVIHFGMGTTPMLYFGSKILNADGAIMVTGSHNPASYNGFKMVMNNKPFFGKQIQKIGDLAARHDFATGCFFFPGLR